MDNTKHNINIKEYIFKLETGYSAHACINIAKQQKAYMRNKFEYFGLKSHTRRDITKPFLIKKDLPEKKDLDKIIKTLWQKPQRDFQYLGMDLMKKYVKQFDSHDIALLEYILVNKSWWDTVDFIASTLVGGYLLKFPSQKNVLIEKWMNSDNIWLQRTTLIFQLKYKNEVDKEILSHCIRSLRDTNEFFINKAIGWALRQYGKYNPEWVKDFVSNTALSPLSKREALKLL